MMYPITEKKRKQILPCSLYTASNKILCFPVLFNFYTAENYFQIFSLVSIYILHENPCSRSKKKIQPEDNTEF